MFRLGNSNYANYNNIHSWVDINHSEVFLNSAVFFWIGKKLLLHDFVDFFSGWLSIIANRNRLISKPLWVILVVEIDFPWFFFLFCDFENDEIFTHNKRNRKWENLQKSIFQNIVIHKVWEIIAKIFLSFQSPSIKWQIIFAFSIFNFQKYSLKTLIDCPNKKNYAILEIR